MFEDEKVFVAIDGGNLARAKNALGFEIDFKRLRAYFEERTRLVGLHYFTTILQTAPGEHNGLIVLTDWLNYNGFRVTTKTVRERHNDNGETRHSGSILVELAMACVQQAPHVDRIVLVSGNSEYKALIETLQSMGKAVTAMSTLQGLQPVVSDEIRRAADEFIDLANIQEDIIRAARAVA